MNAKIDTQALVKAQVENGDERGQEWKLYSRNEMKQRTPNVNSRYSPKIASLGQAFPYYLIGNKSFYLRTLKTFEFIMMGQSK